MLESVFFSEICMHFPSFDGFMCALFNRGGVHSGLTENTFHCKNLQEEFRLFA